MIRIKTFSEGLLDSNEYLVWNESSGRAAIIDCGNYTQETERFVKENCLTVDYIILTHGHYDHAEFTEDHKIAFPTAKLMCHAEEVAVLRDPMANLSAYFGDAVAYPDPDIKLRNGDNVVIRGNSTENDIVFRVIDAPGHTPGSFCLLCDKEQIMFTGDVLFRRGRGRTDFKYGDELTMQKTLRSVLSLPAEITFYSGHGAPSKIGDERPIYGI